MKKLLGIQDILQRNMKNDTVLTFELNFHIGFTDIANHIEEQAKENTKLKAEIDRLNGKSEMYRDMADSFCNNNIKLKAEVEQLKSTISEMETTTKRKDIKMDKEQVRRIVCRLLTADTYYEKFRALESDVDFFKMYMARNKKSEFRFDLRISRGGSFKAFDDIWKKYGYGSSKQNLEVAFAEFMLLHMIIADIYEETNTYTDAEIKEFINYFEQYEETFVKDYVSDFIGCSRGCCAVLKKLEQIKALN